MRTLYSVDEFDWEKFKAAYRKRELDRMPVWYLQGRKLVEHIFDGLRLGGIARHRWEKDVDAVTLRVVCANEGIRQWTKSLGIEPGCFLEGFCPLKDGLVWEVEFVLEDEDG